jgi:hypothetical protein
MITDESAHVDFDDFVCVVTTTRTPDVPSGSAFAVKTRTSMTWSRGNQCRVVVTTGVEWSKSSFIKGASLLSSLLSLSSLEGKTDSHSDSLLIAGIIERSCIDGQKTYHSDLEKAMRAYIATHRNEFVSEGQSLDSDDGDDHTSSPSGGDDSNRDPTSPLLTTAPLLPAPNGGKKDHSAAGPLAPLWDFLEPFFEQLLHQSPKTLLLGAVVVVLVLSNVWTLRSSSSSPPSRADSHPLERAARARAEAGGAEGHHDVAAAVRDVLQDYFAAAGHHSRATTTPAPSSAHSHPSTPSTPSPSPSSSSSSAADRRTTYTVASDEVQQLEAMLDRIEKRVKELRRAVREAAVEGVKAEEVD